MHYIQHLIQFLIALALLAMLVSCMPASKHYAEIATPDLPYIAKIRKERADSSVVVYNSQHCRQIGEACGFFRSHAYAHWQLNHPILPPEYYPDSLEHAADCWAARHAEPREVAAAIQLLSDRERHQDLPLTGDPSLRARRIKACFPEAVARQ